MLSFLQRAFFLSLRETDSSAPPSTYPPPRPPSLSPLLLPSQHALRPPAASWQGSLACCRGRGPAWWAAAGPARSWWSATCSGCTPGSGWLSAGSGTTGRWCLGDWKAVGWGGVGGGGGKETDLVKRSCRWTEEGERGMGWNMGEIKGERDRKLALLVSTACCTCKYYFQHSMLTTHICINITFFKDAEITPQNKSSTLKTCAQWKCW